MNLSSLLLATVLLACSSLSARSDSSSLKPLFDAHGGFSRWNSNQILEFDVHGWPLGDRAPLSDHQTIDLTSRRVLVSATSYRLGFDGKSLWSAPVPGAAGLPTTSYIYSVANLVSMPFALQGAPKVRELGERFRGEQVLEAYEVMLDKSLSKRWGSSVAIYVSTGTGHLEYIRMQPSDLGLQKSLPAACQGDVAWIFRRWSDIDDLSVPLEIDLSCWEGTQPGKPFGTLSFSQIRFSSDAVPRELFARPGDGRIEQDTH